MAWASGYSFVKLSARFATEATEESAEDAEKNKENNTG